MPFNMESLASFGGIKIVESPLCERTVVHVEWKVVRHPIRKRRRNWNVVRTERVEIQRFAYFVQDPSTALGFFGGQVLFMHPEQAAMLKGIR